MEILLLIPALYVVVALLVFSTMCGMAVLHEDYDLVNDRENLISAIKHCATWPYYTFLSVKYIFTYNFKK